MSVARWAWCKTWLETLPSSTERTPASPRDPVTTSEASTSSATSTIVFQIDSLSATAR